MPGGPYGGGPYRRARRSTARFTHSPPPPGPYSGPPPQVPPPPGGPSAGGAPQKGRGSRRNMVIAATAAMALLAGGGAAAYFALAKPTAAYQPLSYAGPVPFTAPVGVDNPAVARDRRCERDPHPATPRACSPPTQRSRRGAGVDLGAPGGSGQGVGVGWARSAGAADRIPTIVNSLTPVSCGRRRRWWTMVLRMVRWWTPRRCWRPGTAVFIDARGVPTVKCVSGDPLTAPLPGTAPSTATVINPTRAADQGQRLREPGDGTVDEQSGKAGPTRPRQRWRRQHALRRPEPGQAGSQGRRSCCPGAAAGQPGA